MKTIVFISTQKSGSSREAIRAAEKLGYYTVLFTDRPSFLEKRSEFPDVHLMQLCNLENTEEIKKAINRLILKALEICAIVSFVDTYCLTACQLAEEYGVNHFSTEAIGNMQSKILSRQLLSQSPYSPEFLSLSEASPLPEKEIDKYLPAIMKSPNSSGSKDVFKINTFKEFRQCMKKLFKKYPGVPVLVEEFLDGPQYLVECVICKKELHIIAIIRQEISFCNERFIVTGYNLLLDLPDNFYMNLRTAVESIVKGHGMETGACHLEMRYVKGQWKLIEINPRISGAGMNKYIEAALGINLVEQTLKLALGQEPNLLPKYKNYTYSDYVTISKTGILEKVSGRNKASKCPGVKAVYIKPRKGALLTPPVSMGNRYAYVIANGSSEQEAKDNAKHAASLIQFHLLPHNEEEDPTTSNEGISVEEKNNVTSVTEN